MNKSNKNKKLDSMQNESHAIYRVEQKKSC